MLMLRTIIAPLLGGVIGYITNDLAIRMLFRPRKAIYIGKFHVPFTPGLIPSQQARIAQSIGEVVSGQLLNEETLRQTLLSPQTIDKLREKIQSMLEGLSNDTRTVSDLLEMPAIRDKAQISVDDLQVKMTVALYNKIIEAKLGYAVVDSVVGNRMDFLTQNKWIASVVGDVAQNSIRDKLAEKVDEIVAERAPDAAAAITTRFREELLDARLCDLREKYKDREAELTERVLDLYVSILGGNLSRLLKAINIEGIVVDKINGLNPAELEQVIFGLMKRELRAIVYLGAALGFLMGFINLLL